MRRIFFTVSKIEGGLDLENILVVVVGVWERVRGEGSWEGVRGGSLGLARPGAHVWVQVPSRGEPG